MELSSQESKVLNAVAALRLAEEHFFMTHISTPQSRDPESEQPTTLDVRTINVMENVWTLVTQAREALEEGNETLARVGEAVMLLAGGHPAPFIAWVRENRRALLGRGLGPRCADARFAHASRTRSRAAT
jgi:hypothetical protein